MFFFIEMNNFCFEMNSKSRENEEHLIVFFY